MSKAINVKRASVESGHCAFRLNGELLKEFRARVKSEDKTVSQVLRRFVRHYILHGEEKHEQRQSTAL